MRSCKEYSSNHVWLAKPFFHCQSSGKFRFHDLPWVILFYGFLLIRLMFLGSTRGCLPRLGPPIPHGVNPKKQLHIPKALRKLSRAIKILTPFVISNGPLLSPKRQFAAWKSRTGYCIYPNSFVTQIAQKLHFVFGITKKLKLQFSIQKCSCLILNFGGKVGIRCGRNFWHSICLNNPGVLALSCSIRKHIKAINISRHTKAY